MNCVEKLPSGQSIDTQYGVSPLHIPFARHSLVAGPINVNPSSQSNVASSPTEVPDIFIEPPLGACRDPQSVNDRGSCMSAHVLLNLLNELGKRDQMRGLLSIWSLFHNKFDKFNNTGAWMLDSILKPSYNRSLFKLIISDRFQFESL